MPADNSSRRPSGSYAYARPAVNEVIDDQLSVGRREIRSDRAWNERNKERCI